MPESLDEIFKRAQAERAREESDPYRPLGTAESYTIRMIPDMQRTLEDIEQKIIARKMTDEDANKIHTRNKNFSARSN